jgi:Zn-dependent peptidase ImmA (M78 family)
MARRQTKSPEEYAVDLRERLNIMNIPVPVDRIARLLGAEIRLSPLDDELSGMIYIKSDTPVIGVNALHHPNRQRFTIAHEIGHLEMHRELIVGKVHVDKVFPVLMRDVTSETGTVDIEIAANQFAAELLIPRKVLSAMLGERMIDIDDDRPIEELAKKFRVSKKAMEYRINNIAGSRLHGTPDEKSR